MNSQALIIDDNHTNLLVLKHALQLEGIEPLLCYHPDEIAGVMTEATDLSLVFLDLEFPNHDGLDLIHDLKDNPQLSDIPFVAYTVHISEQNEAAEAGFHSFLGKPLNVEVFPSQLQRILQGEPVWYTG